MENDAQVPEAELCEGGLMFEIHLNSGESLRVPDQGRCWYISMASGIDDLIDSEILNSTRVGDILKQIIDWKDKSQKVVVNSMRQIFLNGRSCVRVFIQLKD